ncbi:sugar ABC transporter substrate-binding protein [Jannaschia seohaensis]|uniref:Ribose transport system substrate-binding protein n=1 Tax=Jannaschia seohaensis TaxID=475081 RepID=A0A2Y9B6Z0_9RHOB|nr:sugar ABC transporter substrate-binding protein [Jannaschia seohaensis]PWJ11752.1 ribose transport system substrate-binding protein [Jannaschia seohaensis]SSA51268.1 ribose transport system substrate-binding protein [Jannaschia seohaensis]
MTKRPVLKATTAAILLGVLSTQASADSTTRVALVPGGPHPYFAAWEQAGKDAARDFGLAAADYRVPQKWELSMQNQILESLVTQGYNAFLVFPGDPVGTVAIANELAGTGAPVLALAGCLQDPSEAKFCMGTDTGNSAYLGAKELLEVLGPGAKIAHFTGFLVDPNTQLRIDAVARAAEEAGAEVIQVIADIDAPEPAEEKINAYLAAHAGDVDGIITTAWVPAVVAANALRRIGDKRIKMVGIDHDEVVMNAIRDGYVHGTMLQNPYGQGYIGSFVADRLRSGCEVKADAPFKSIALTDKFIDSGTVFAGIDAVDNYVASMQAITAELMEGFEDTYLTCS